MHNYRVEGVVKIKTLSTKEALVKGSIVQIASENKSELFEVVQVVHLVTESEDWIDAWQERNIPVVQLKRLK